MVTIPNEYLIYGGIFLVSFPALIYIFIRFFRWQSKKLEELKKRRESEERKRKLELTKLSKINKKPEKVLSKAEDQEPDMIYYKGKRRDYFKRSRFQLRYWLDRRQMRKNPTKMILIRMELANGKYREFIKADDDDTFLYNKQKYTTAGVNKYFNMDAGDNGMWCYDFHEKLVLPVKKNVQFNDDVKRLVRIINETSDKELEKAIKKNVDVQAEIDKISASGVIEVETSLHPTVFQRLLDSKIVQALVAGASIAKLFRVMLLLIIIALLLVGVDTMIDIYDSGILDKISQSFKK